MPDPGKSMPSASIPSVFRVFFVKASAITVIPLFHGCFVISLFIGTGAVFFNRGEEKQSLARSAIICKIFQGQSVFRNEHAFHALSLLFEGIAETS